LATDLLGVADKARRVAGATAHLMRLNRLARNGSAGIDYF
jgi:hypothetical protein